MATDEPNQLIDTVLCSNQIKHRSQTFHGQMEAFETNALSQLLKVKLNFRLFTVGKVCSCFEEVHAATVLQELADTNESWLKDSEFIRPCPRRFRRRVMRYDFFID